MRKGWFLAERIFRGFFYFWAAGFLFFYGFCRRNVSPHFCGKSAQKNPPGKSPAKSSNIVTTKIPGTFLQRGRAKMFFSPAPLQKNVGYFLHKCWRILPATFGGFSRLFSPTEMRRKGLAPNPHKKDLAAQR